MDARNDLVFFILILVGLFAAWIGTGGPERARNEQSQGTVLPESKTVIREDTSKSVPAKDTEEQEEEKTQIPSGISSYKDQVTIVKSSTGPRRTEASKEYFEIQANRSNTSPISITGWRVTSLISGVSYAIKNGVHLPQSSSISPETAIFLNPGDRAYIATGRSPIGVSFRTNLCTGYFEQFQDFSPSLRRECPRPKDELDVTVDVIRTFGNTCLDLIERLPRCEMYTKSLPLGSTPECVEFVTTEINYNGCVSAHKNDPDFYKSEWRIYLGRDAEIWRDKRETIVLLDNEGRTVDTFTY